MKIVVTGQEIRQIITDTPRFLMNDDNANVYCMTMPQITDRYVKLPAKIIYLGALVTGDVAGMAVTSLAPMPLSYLLNSFKIRRKQNTVHSSAFSILCVNI